MSLTKIAINADMGESLGKWRLGEDDDDEIMSYIDAANIACGFHASDPSTVHKTVLLAKKYNVDCGAHPGFPDIVGFGRRRMELTPQEVADIIIYQVGAIKGFCEVEGVKLSHIKPHGALYFYLLSSEEICTAAVRAIKKFNVPYYGLPGTLHESVAAKEGVPFVPEVYADIEYTPQGALISPLKCRVIEPHEVAERGTSPYATGTIPAQDSPTPAKLPLKGKPYSICIHSDFSKAIERLKVLRKAVDELNAKHFA